MAKISLRQVRGTAAKIFAASEAPETWEPDKRTPGTRAEFDYAPKWVVRALCLASTLRT